MMPTVYVNAAMGADRIDICMCVFVCVCACVYVCVRARAHMHADTDTRHREIDTHLKQLDPQHHSGNTNSYPALRMRLLTCCFPV